MTIVNDEFRRLWKEAVLATLKKFPQHLPTGTKDKRHAYIHFCLIEITYETSHMESRMTINHKRINNSV
jgi:hypothetical protein